MFLFHFTATLKAFSEASRAWDTHMISKVLGTTAGEKLQRPQVSAQAHHDM
jgi:hypothetical protein